MPEPHRGTSPHAAAARTAAILGTALLLTAGCASSVPHRHTTPESAGDTPSASAGAAPGGHAADSLAARVRDCSPQSLTVPVAAHRLGMRGPTPSTSAAACTLRGRTAIILTFGTAAGQATTDRQLASRVAYYTTGPHWSAAPTDTSEPIGQQSVIQDIALALHGRIHTGGR